MEHRPLARFVIPDAAARPNVPRGNAIDGDPRSRGRRILRSRAYLAITGIDWRWLWLAVVPVSALVIIGPVLFAGLGPIDDWQIPSILNEHGGSLSIFAVPGVIVQYAIEATRFRPFWWTVRISEMAVWGTWAPGWYLDRLVLLVATMGLAALIARRYIALPLAVAVAILIVAGPQAEAWYRLGPQEAIAMPLLLGGFAAAGRHRFAFVLLVLAALTKESFVPLAFVALWPARRDRAAIIAAVAVAVIAIVALPRALAYADGRSATDLASQGRYLLPALLIPLGVVLLALRPIRHPRMVVIATACLAVLASVGLAVGHGSASTSAATTAAWQASLATVRADLAAEPGSVLVLSPRSTEDYELVYSLRAYIPDGRAMVEPDWTIGSSPLDATLDTDLRARVESGGRGFVPWTNPSSNVTVSLDGGYAFVIRR